MHPPLTSLNREVGRFIFKRNEMKKIKNIDTRRALKRAGDLNSSEKNIHKKIANLRSRGYLVKFLDIGSSKGRYIFTKNKVLIKLIKKTYGRKTPALIIDK